MVILLGKIGAHTSQRGIPMGWNEIAAPWYASYKPCFNATDRGEMGDINTQLPEVSDTRLYNMLYTPCAPEAHCWCIRGFQLESSIEELIPANICG